MPLARLLHRARATPFPERQATWTARLRTRSSWHPLGWQRLNRLRGVRELWEGRRRMGARDGPGGGSRDVRASRRATSWGTEEPVSTGAQIDPSSSADDVAWDGSLMVAVGPFS